MNIGNTCYFNSLLQTYFSIPELVNQVLQYKLLGGDKEKDDIKLQFIKHLQVLFSRLISSNSKFADPQNILSNMTDSFGERITFADGR